MSDDADRWLALLERAAAEVDEDARTWPEAPEDPVPYEKAALWQLESTVQPEDFLHFIETYGPASYRWVSRALDRMRATEVKALVEAYFALIEPVLDEADDSPLFSRLDPEALDAMDPLDGQLWDALAEMIPLGLATYGG